MTLLSLLDVSISFGGPLLLDQVNLQISRGERLSLVGRNGAGKSTLMKILAGDLKPDSGQVFRSDGVPVARLQQEVPEGIEQSVREVVYGLNHPAHDWERDIRVDSLLEQTGLDGGASFKTLSAGLKRRVMLAQGLVEDPDLLLLDEPTNHLDIESILWLEDFLLKFSGALLFVTHDRVFLRRLATRILELDRGKITSWNCDYDKFLERKEAMLEAEAKQEAAFDKKLAQEEAWLRRGVKARRTRNEGRVRALQEMRKERMARRSVEGNVQMVASDSTPSGQKVIEAEKVSFSYNEKPIIRDFSTLIMRGDKVGLVGPNGAGKSTLLRLLLGKLTPTDGSIKIGSRLEIAYFDQLREDLDEEKTVQENVSDGNETVTVNGESRHIISYLQDFLFSPARARSPVKILSGGERNRLLLARLFTRPANLLVLDEPTNDLDAETLELLEALLVEYSGTLLVVSHDREFLNNVATSLFVFEANGQITESIGGYDDYLRLKERTAQPQPSSTATVKRKANPAQRPARPRRMTNRELRELENLPSQIEKLEQKQKKIAEELADPALYQEGADSLIKKQRELEEIENELSAAFERWEELETLQAELS